MSKATGWARYCQELLIEARTGFSLDLSLMEIDEAYRASMEEPLRKALGEMRALERGAIANADEGRRVGHYWLRAPELAPDEATREAIESAMRAVRELVAGVHAGTIRPPGAERFSSALVVGIGGSALGPQFVSDALSEAGDAMRVRFIDNTDPDGIDRALRLTGSLREALTVVISKSGGTKETRNGMLEAQAAYERAGLDFAAHAVAVTGEGSELDRYATERRWIARLPMWDWVGGRTSEFSAVGMLPAALQGVDIDGMILGAREMDEATREPDPRRNIAAAMALAWHRGCDGRGARDMVVLPYKDRLLFLSRYLQQLVMESLGKDTDRAGNPVSQGLTVYGNKGSTDQHAYVQQLRDGVDNFFTLFVEVLRDRGGASLAVEPDVTSGDYLVGFLEGTRRALAERGRRSITLTIPAVDARSLGALIALAERAVGLYASLVNVNAYHQPGVEAGKRAASEVLAVQRLALNALRASGRALTAEEVAARAGTDEVEAVYKALRHAAANPDHGVSCEGTAPPSIARFSATSR